MTDDIWASARKPAKTWEDYPAPVLDSDTGCLRWQGPNGDPDGRTKYGYLPGNAQTPARMAHRVAWEREWGTIPAGLVIDHVWDRGCRWKDCVNVEHLEPVTERENTRRGGKARSLRAQQRRDRTKYVNELWARKTGPLSATHSPELAAPVHPDTTTNGGKP